MSLDEAAPSDTVAERRTEYLLVEELVEHPRNPKGHTPDLRASFARFGFTEPPLIDERTGMLAAGHGRKALLEELEASPGRPDDWPEHASWPPSGIVVGDDGRWRVPVTRGWASRDDAEAMAYMIASNRLVELGGWETRPLASILDELRAGGDEGLLGVGYGAEQVDALLASIAPKAPPEEFRPYDPTAMELAHSCPRCGFEWTGSG